MKEIKITTNELTYSNPYIDFTYDGIDYRWYTSEDKFTKLFEFGFNAPHARAVRGNERNAVFAQLKEMVQELQQPKENNVISIVTILEKKSEQQKEKDLINFALDNFLSQGTEFLQEIMKQIQSGDVKAYRELTEPILRRNVIKEFNTK